MKCIKCNGEGKELFKGKWISCFTCKGTGKLPLSQEQLDDHFDEIRKKFDTNTQSES